MNKEIWKNIGGYDGKYQISNYGNVKKHFNNEEKEVNKHITEKGYYCVYLYNKGKLKKHVIHRLVANTFLTNKEEYKCMPYEDKLKINTDNLQINHKNENKLDNRVENLEWCTCSYNINYGQRNSKHSKKMAKKVKQYDLNWNLIKEWDSLIEIQRKLGITIGTLYRINNKKSYNGYYWVYKN